MIERRERTVQTRKANAIMVKRKKDKLMEVMERARSDANNAERILATIGLVLKPRRRISRSSCRRWSTTRRARWGRRPRASCRTCPQKRGHGAAPACRRMRPKAGRRP